MIVTGPLRRTVLELIELSSVKVFLFSFCSKTGSIRDNPY